MSINKTTLIAVCPGESRDAIPQAKTYLAGFIGVLALYCLWVLSLPVFPSQDGGAHLYYVHALRNMFHGESLFTHSYTLRTPLPPYTVQYAILFALEPLLGAIWAEKVVVCLILIVTATGFRALSRTSGPAGSLFSLWALPLTLSWPLFMGFHNFCLSLGISFWALWLWFRAATGRSQRFVLFLCAVVIVGFTHPVPLIMMLSVVAVDLALRMLRLGTTNKLGPKAIARTLRLELVSFAVAFSSLLYLRLFINSKDVETSIPLATSRLASLKQLILFQFMCFGSGGASTKGYRIGLAVVLALSLAAGGTIFWRRWRSGLLDQSSSFMISAVGLLCLMPILPSRVNGLDYFSERLLVYVFLFSIAAACAWDRLSRRLSVSLYIGALMFSGLALGMAEALVRPVAEDVALAEHWPSRLATRTGLVLGATEGIGPSRLTGNPYDLWSATRLFRSQDILLLNDPWAGPPNILPVNRASPRPNSFLSNFELLNPSQLYLELLASEEARRRILPHVDLIVFVGLPQSPEHVEPVLDRSGKSWACTQAEWFFVCETDAHASRTTIKNVNPASFVRFQPGSAFKLVAGPHYLARR